MVGVLACGWLVSQVKVNKPKVVIDVEGGRVEFHEAFGV